MVYPYTKQVVAQGVPPVRKNQHIANTYSDTKVQEADIQDVEGAVTSANAAFPAWRDLGTDKRGIYLRKLAQLILESNNELAKLETLSTGRPISQFFDASAAADYLRTMLVAVGPHRGQPASTHRIT